MFHCAAHFEPIRTADHFVDRAKAQLGHMLAHLLGDEAHEVHHVGWIALKFLAQLGVLRGDPHRAGVEVTDPHHDAAQGHQGSGGKAEFLGAEHRGNDHVAAGLQLAVGLHGDAAAQVVEHQGLVRLRKPQLPGQARMLMLVCGEAPVPPSWPLIKTTSAWPLATPAAMVPTPISETSFTLMRADDWRS